MLAQTPSTARTATSNTLRSRRCSDIVCSAQPSHSTEVPSRRALLTTVAGTFISAQCAPWAAHAATPDRAGPSAPSIFESKQIACEANTDFGAAERIITDFNLCSSAEGVDPGVCAGAARLKLERLYKATGVIYESLPSLAEQAVRRGPFKNPRLTRLPPPPGTPPPEVNAEIWAAQVSLMRKEADAALAGVMTTTFSLLAEEGPSLDPAKLTTLDGQLKSARAALTKLRRTA